MDDEKPKLVPIEAVANHFSVSVSTIRVWIRKNMVPKDTYIKVGTTYRFNLDAMEEALRDSEKVAEPEARGPMKLYEETDNMNY